MGTLVLEIWGVWSTLLVLLFPGPLWLKGIVPVKVLSMGLFKNYSYSIEPRAKKKTLKKQDEKCKYKRTMDTIT